MHNWWKTAKALNEKAPIPENFDNIEVSEKFPEWRLQGGGNDWERAISLMSFLIDPKNDRPCRVWATINYGHLKGFKNSNGEKVDKKVAADAIKWGEEAPKKWLEVAKKLFKDSDEYEYDWVDACVEALQSQDVQPYVKDWGIEKKDWNPQDPKKTLDRLQRK